MIKRVPLSEIKLGMFIHDFNCSWVENPFFVSQMLIENEGQIKKIQSQGISEVYIDSDKGVDFSEGKPEEKIREEVDEGISHVDVTINYERRRVPVEKEMENAIRVKKEAMVVVHGFMEDARLGRSVDVEKVDKSVTRVIDSIFNNKDALEVMGKVRTADQYTFMHSLNVCVLMVSFAKSMNLNMETIRQIGIGAMMHDIGKMKVPLEVLNKAGRLTEAEFEQIKLHVVESRKLLDETKGVSEIAKEVASQHHERVDGKGYYRNLKGNEISLYGQMASIVDVYDALTSDRVYHKGMSSVDALRKLFEWRDTNFEGDLVQQFIHAVGIYPTGTLVRLESGVLAVVKEQGSVDLLHPRIVVVYNAKKNHFVQPFDVDLAHPTAKFANDKIVGAEKADKWKINPLSYLDLPIPV